MKKELFIGLMSGTSLDAVDAALVEFLDNNKIKLIDTVSYLIPPELKQDILALCHPGYDGIQRLGIADIELGNAFAFCCIELMNQHNLMAEDIIAIGSHGQTIRHVPNAEVPFTLQIGDPNIITQTTGVTTVADFRRRDLASGGQAAPLAPAFHQYLFQTENINRFIINIGGMSNLTFLPRDLSENIVGFDTGPGNTLIDAWIQQHKQQPFDENGYWAQQGSVNTSLLKLLLADPYFAKKPPKSTGREYFNLAWLDKALNSLQMDISINDTQTTLCELTARTIADAIKSLQITVAEIYICGGGVHNDFLMQRIEKLLSDYPVASTAEIGLNPDWVEAVTFAWLARQTINGHTGNLPSVTGAKQATILGAIYRA